MAMNAIRTTERDLMCNALVDALDVGSTDATGDVELRTAITGGGMLGANLPFPTATAFGVSISGVATRTAGTMEDVSADNSVTVLFCTFRDRDNNIIWEGNVGTSGTDIVFNTNVFTAGDLITITTMTVTMPAA